MTDDHPDKKPWVAKALVAIVGLLIAPVVYIASIGPAAAMAHQGQISKPTYLKFYLPVERLVSRTETTSKYAMQYLQWWDRHWPGGELDDF